METYRQRYADLEIEEELEDIILRLHQLADRAGVRYISVSTGRCKLTDGIDNRYGTIFTSESKDVVMRHLNKEGDLMGILQEARDKEQNETTE